MKISVICVGGLKEDYLKALERDFMKQMAGVCRIIVIPSEKASKNAPVHSIKEKEGAKILKHIKKGSFVIALDVLGQPLDSPGFHRLLKSGGQDIVLIMGGTFGLSDAVMKKSHFLLSFSLMTFPHHVMRIILLEQLAAWVKRP